MSSMQFLVGENQRSDQEKSTTAKQMRQREIHYAILHHKQRIEWLDCERPTWDDGTLVLPSLRHQLLKDSKNIVANPAAYGLRFDLSDTEYIARLDAFESENV